MIAINLPKVEFLNVNLKFKKINQESRCIFIMFAWTFLNISIQQWVLLMNDKLITMLQK